MLPSSPDFPHATDDSSRRQQQLLAALLLAAVIVMLRLFNVSELARVRFAPSIRSLRCRPCLHRCASSLCSRLVLSGTKFVEGQQNLRCRLLDFVFNFMSISVGVEFYITFLPFLFWIDQVCAVYMKNFPYWLGSRP